MGKSTRSVPKLTTPEVYTGAMMGSCAAARQYFNLQKTLWSSSSLQGLTFYTSSSSPESPKRLLFYNTTCTSCTSTCNTCTSSPINSRSTNRLLYTAVAAGGMTCALCAWLGYRALHTTTAVCTSNSGSSLATAAVAHTNIGETGGGGVFLEESVRLPSVRLYQYQTCPFCCKTRAFLDYYRIKYEVVEVNPLFRREIKFSKYRKVPFIVCGDDVQVNDSSLLISVLRTCMVNEGKLSVAQAMELYPEMSYTDNKGKAQTERTNKYFIMLGEEGNTKGVSLAERREEREWREWVDNKLVHVLPPNIYRTPSESLQAFDYISRVGNFNVFERAAAKYLGAFGMYFIAKLLKKKYQLDSDVRNSLYRYCNEWCKAVGKDRQFMGGKHPNLADLAVYGVLSSIEGYDSFKDMLKHTQIGPWYFATQKLVKQHKAASDGWQC